MKSTDIAVIKYYIFSFILLVSGATKLAAQGFVSQSDIRFAEYLVDSRSWNDARFFLNQLTEKNYEEFAQDVYWLQGWNDYQAGWQRRSTLALEKVGESHPNFLKSQFYLNYQRAWLSHNTQDSALLMTAQNSLSQLQTSTSLENELRLILLGGFSLMEQDFDQYDEIREQWAGSFPQLRPHQNQLNELEQLLRNRPQKSPAFAAFLSAILPGSGKWYAGKKGEAIAAFLQVGIPAGITLESYLKSNSLDARTIVAGSFTALFYTANIYGSYWTVRTANNDINDALNNQILFEIHIPVRTVFP